MAPLTYRWLGGDNIDGRGDIPLNALVIKEDLVLKNDYIRRVIRQFNLGDHIPRFIVQIPFHLLDQAEAW